MSIQINKKLMIKIHTNASISDSIKTFLINASKANFIIFRNGINIVIIQYSYNKIQPINILSQNIEINTASSCDFMANLCVCARTWRLFKQTVWRNGCGVSAEVALLYPDKS